MLAHVFPARGETLGYSEPRKPKHLPFGKHVPVNDVVSVQHLPRRFACTAYTQDSLGASAAARARFHMV